MLQIHSPQQKRLNTSILRVLLPLLLPRLPNSVPTAHQALTSLSSMQTWKKISMKTLQMVRQMAVPNSLWSRKNPKKTTTTTTTTFTPTH